MCDDHVYGAEDAGEYRHPDEEDPRTAGGVETEERRVGGRG